MLSQSHLNLRYLFRLFRLIFIWFLFTLLKNVTKSIFIMFSNINKSENNQQYTNIINNNDFN